MPEATEPASPEFARLRARQRDTPEDRTPIDWRHVVTFSEGFSPEQRTVLEASLTRIASTQAGQEMLRTMVSRADQNQPLRVVPTGESPLQQMTYDSGPHHIEVAASFLETQPTEAARDYYLAHELGHAATHAHDTFYRADSQTMLDHHLTVGREEGLAEDYARRVTRELGNTEPSPYVPPDQQALFRSAIEASRDEPQEAQDAAVGGYLRGLIVQSTIDGVDREGVRARIDEFVATMREEHGMDIRASVDRVLARPAPRFNERDEVIRPPEEPGERGRSGANGAMIAEPPMTAASGIPSGIRFDGEFPAGETLPRPYTPTTAPDANTPALPGR